MRWKTGVLLSVHRPGMDQTCVLPGGDIDGSREDYAAKLRRRYPFPTECWRATIRALTAAILEWILGEVNVAAGFRRRFPVASFTKRNQVPVDHEWVRRTEDAIRRRTKEGMWLTAEQCNQSRITQWPRRR